jgi:predicted RNA-binding Zn-ribbon protein involved in translation (DUF1610 family)
MEMVTVRTFDNYFSANIILGRLREAGIDCYLKDEYTVTIDPILSNAIGGIKLNVYKEDEEMVTTILKEFDEEYLRSAVCPKCNTSNILLVPKQGAGNFITAIFTWLFSSYAVAPENIYQCQQCGFESKTLPENLSAYN